MTDHDPQVSWYTRVISTSNTQMTGMPVSQALYHIRQRPDIKERVEAIRALDTSAEDYEERAKTLKAQLPAVSFAAFFPEHRRRTNPWTHTELIPLDIDLPEAESLALRARLQKWPHLFAAWASARNKLHGLVRITPAPTTNEEHRHACLAVADAMRESFGVAGLDTDPSAKDVTRVLFVSHDPTLYYNPEAEPLPIPPIEEDPPPAAPAQAKHYPQAEAADVAEFGPRIGAYLPPKLIQLAAARANRHHLIYDCSHAAAGMLDADAPDAAKWEAAALNAIRHAAVVSGYEQKVGAPELDRVIDEAWQQGKSSPLPSRRRSTRRPGGGKRRDAPAPNVDPPPEGEYHNEDLRADELSLRYVLGDLGYNVRLNVRSDVVELRHNDDGYWMPIDDYAESYLIELIARTYTTHSPNLKKTIRLRFGQARWKLALQAIIHTSKVDPFLEWLESLPKWDTITRLPTRLRDTLNAADDELSRWASQHTLLLAIERAYHPGSHGHEIPVLLGPQGLGKDTYFRTLFPPALAADWVSDRLQFGVDPGRQVEAMLGPVIVVASEMPGLSRAEVEHVKVFIQRTRDDFRLAYRRNPQPLPRRVAIAGTANELNLPNDPTGERRFVPIPVGLDVPDEDIPQWQQHVQAENLRDHEQLWAEALHRYHTRQHSSLPAGLKRTQRERSSLFRARDELIENAVLQALITIASDHYMVSPSKEDLVITTHDLLRASPTDIRGNPILSSERDGRIRKALENHGAIRSPKQRNIRRGDKRTKAYVWEVPYYNLSELLEDPHGIPTDYE